LKPAIFFLEYWADYGLATGNWNFSGVQAGLKQGAEMKYI
jgi:hypothetical protein